MSQSNVIILVVTTFLGNTDSTNGDQQRVSGASGTSDRPPAHVVPINATLSGGNVACCLQDGICADIPSDQCVTQGGTPHPPGTGCAQARCGDGKLELCEMCDDGNVNAGDGCDSKCRLENDDCLGAIAFTPPAMSLVINNDFAAASSPPGGCNPEAKEMQNDVWFSFMHDYDYPLVMAVVPDGYDAVVTVYAAPDCAGVSIENEIGCWDEPEPITISFTALAHVTYFFQVGAKGSSETGGVTMIVFDFVVRACCLPDGSCEELTDPQCMAQGGTPTGLGKCEADTACCLPNGDCLTLEPNCCSLVLGGIAVPGTSCGDPATACCFPNGDCLDRDPVCCSVLGGVAVSDTLCGDPDTGCCLPNGDCIGSYHPCCVLEGGVPHTGKICTKPEACCSPEGDCANIDPLCCADIGGRGQGFDTVCLGDVQGDDCDDACPCEPDCGKQNIECLNPGFEYDNRTPVGRLTAEGSGHCTGWLIGAPNCVITNRHCITTDGTPSGPLVDVTTRGIEFNFECDECEDGLCTPADAYPVIALIHENPDLDYAILQVAGDPAAVWGTLGVDSEPPIVSEAIYEIHHGGTLRKGFDEGTVVANHVPGICDPGAEAEVSITAIASGGASGSPVFRASNHCVMAICHCGPDCAPGFALPMSAIIPDAVPHLLAHSCVFAKTDPCDSALAPPEIVHEIGPDAETSPCSGYIDPRLEVDVLPPNNPAGLQEARIRFDRPVFKGDGSDIDATSFELSECGQGEPPNVISAEYLDADHTVVRVRWDRPLKLQEWTTLRADVYNQVGVPILSLGDLGPGVSEPDRIDLGALPGDINQDGEVEPLDLIRYRQFIEDACSKNPKQTCPDCGGEHFYFDIDRNDDFPLPADFLRLRQIFLGAPPATREWILEHLNCSQP